jgi:hypothetical protein
MEGLKRSGRNEQATEVQRNWPAWERSTTELLVYEDLSCLKLLVHETSNRDVSHLLREHEALNYWYI